MTPAITNYEYSTDGGTTWAEFDPPVTTPIYSSLAGMAPLIVICKTSGTGAALATGSTYDVQLRAVNADGPGAASATRNVTMSSLDFLEMNPCGGGSGTQDLKVMTGGTEQYFNVFGIYRSGLKQIYNGTDTPGYYCFYIFVEGNSVGCSNASNQFPTGNRVNWTSVDPPVQTHSGKTWTIEQTGHYTSPLGFAYALTTTLEYTSPNAYIDVHHVLTTPNVTSAQQTLSGTATSGSTSLTVGSATGLWNGMCVTGTGIAAGTVVKSLAPTTVTLDRNTTGAVSGTVTFSACAKIYHGSDMYLDGSDDGPGDSTVIGGNRLVAQVTDPASIDPSTGANGGVGGVMETTGHPFSSWVEGLYSCMFGKLSGSCTGSPWGNAYGGDWPNTIDTSTSQDAGTAAVWNVNPTGAAGTYTVDTWVYFAAGSPTLTGSFASTTATAGVPVNLNLAISNAPSWAWTAAAFDLALPSGASAGSITNTCGGTASVTAGVLSLTGGSLSTAGLNCTITVPVTFSSAGTYTVTNANVSGNWISQFGAPQPLVKSVSGEVTVTSGSAPAGGGGGGSTPASTPEAAPTTAPAPNPSPTRPSLEVIPHQSNSNVPASGMGSGAGLLLVGGVPSGLVIEPNAPSRPTGLNVRGDGFTMSLAGLGAQGRPLGLSADGGALVLQKDRMAQAQGTGFLPNSEIRLFMLYPPRYIGSITTDASGNFSGQVPIPMDLASGLHTLQANGYTPQQKVRSVSIGVQVMADRAPRMRMAKATVTFDALSDQLSAVAKAQLRALARGRVGSARTTLVVGYVQPTSTTANDQTLSTMRAKRVASYLRSLGLKGRVVSRGDGTATETGAAGRKVVIAIKYSK
ncbi:MAG: hypothetical protein KGP12_10450 [Actinomycetales bacterium]|nr:hypothetical protein [Actinomycetales bacterium]